MSIRLIRQESETPNVTNTDDARMVRYAYGGYNGFVKNRGTEIGYSINGSTFKVTSGVLNLQGWEAEIDANGVDISTSGSVNKRYFSVFYEVNAATDTASVKSSYSETGYPAIDAGDDLTETTNGTARLLLYTFDVQNTAISNVQKKVQAIPFVSDAIDEIYEGLENGTIIPAKSNDSKSINSLEIKRDENGVLKIGDTIIPQKKLLWSGSINCTAESSSTAFSLNETATSGRYIIEYIDMYYAGGERKLISAGCRDIDTGMLPVDFEPLSKAGKFINKSARFERATLPKLLIEINTKNAEWNGIYYREIQTDGTVSINFHRGTLTAVYKIIE